MTYKRKATHVIESSYSAPTPHTKRHTYCDEHFEEALRQCPLDPSDKLVPVKDGERCEECGT